MKRRFCRHHTVAMTYYNNFIKQYPQSVYVKNALLNQGLIYYNTERSEQALATFDRLLTQYPGTDEARDALSTVKNIYIAQNRVDDYFSYVKRTTKVLGDPLYSSRKKTYGLEGQALHSCSIEFIHPRTGERIYFEAPLPKYYEDVLSTLDEIRE
mgnify:CR=1 FL=1